MSRRTSLRFGTGIVAPCGVSCVGSSRMSEGYAAVNIEHDWRERVDHADERLKEVDGLITDFIASDPYGVVRKVDGEMPNYVLTLVMSEEKAVPRRVSLLLAEIFGHLRSSLDHLACTLARVHTGSDDEPSGTQFPIFKDRDYFFAVDKTGNPKRGSGRFQMRGLSKDAQAVVERLQPYHRGADATDDPLWLIHDSAVVDKHRKPHLTGAILEGTSMGIQNMWGVDLSYDSLGRIGAFNRGTEVARIAFTVTDPTNYTVDMHTDIAYGVAFAPKGPGRGSPVVPTVEALIGHLRDVVFPELEPLV